MRKMQEEKDEKEQQINTLHNEVEFLQTEVQKSKE